MKKILLTDEQYKRFLETTDDYLICPSDLELRNTKTCSFANSQDGDCVACWEFAIAENNKRLEENKEKK